MTEHIPQPRTEDQPIWRPRPRVPPRKISEGPTDHIPLVGPRSRGPLWDRLMGAHGRHEGDQNWRVAPGAGLLVGLCLAAAVAGGFAVGDAITPDDVVTTSCETP